MLAIEQSSTDCVARCCKFGTSPLAMFGTLFWPYNVYRSPNNLFPGSILLGEAEHAPNVAGIASAVVSTAPTFPRLYKAISVHSTPS